MVPPELGCAILIFYVTPSLAPLRAVRMAFDKGMPAQFQAMWNAKGDGRGVPVPE